MLEWLSSGPQICGFSNIIFTFHGMIEPTQRPPPQHEAINWTLDFKHDIANIKVNCVAFISWLWSFKFVKRYYSIQIPWFKS